MSMTWNSENRMTESVSQNIYSGAKTLTRYKYDHEGNRVVKSSNYGEVVTPTPEISYRNDSIVTKHIFVSGVRVASKVCDEKSSNTYYQSVDHLGSTNVLTDDKGEFYEHIETFPDGSIWVKEYVDQSGVNTVFTSHEMDVETKFFYAKARYYDAQLGRFISVDPIINKYLNGEINGGIYNPNNLNLYQYCYNNPVRLIDPDGLAPKRNKDSWTWRILNFFTGGKWAEATGDRANDTAAAGSEFSDEMLKAEADFLIAGDIKVLATGTNFRGEKQGTGGLLLAALPFIGKFKYLGKIAKVSVYVGKTKATRMLIGKADKIAVIGRNMKGRVIPFAKGIGAEYFIPSKRALKAFDLGDSSLIFKENLSWAKQLKKQGYTVYDVGLDPRYTKAGNFNKGKYYGMETKVVFGDKK